MTPEQQTALAALVDAHMPVIADVVAKQPSPVDACVAVMPARDGKGFAINYVPLAVAREKFVKHVTEAGPIAKMARPLASGFVRVMCLVNEFGDVYDRPLSAGARPEPSAVGSSAWLVEHSGGLIARLLQRAWKQKLLRPERVAVSLAYGGEKGVSGWWNKTSELAKRWATSKPAMVDVLKRPVPPGKVLVLSEQRGGDRVEAMYVKLADVERMAKVAEAIEKVGQGGR